MQEEIEGKEAALQALLKEFEAEVLEKAKAGEIPRPEKRVDEGDDAPQRGGGGGGGGGGGRHDDFGAEYGSATYGIHSGQRRGGEGGGGRRFGGGGGYDDGAQPCTRYACA